MTLKKPDIFTNIEQIDNKIGDLSTLGVASTVEKFNQVNTQLADMMYNVKTFKCADGERVKGDGIHDDTTGIQAALNYIGQNGGETLFFPKGTYLCTNTLTIPTDQKITIKGVNELSSIILFNIVGKTELTPAIDCRGSNTNRMYLSIKDIQIQGNQNPNIIGVWMDYLHENTFDNIKVVLFGSHGIKVDTAINLTFLNCISKYNGGDGIHFTAGPFHNTCQIIGGIYISNDGNGIYYSSGNNIAIIKPTVELNGGYGVYLRAIKGGSILSPYLEANSLNQLRVDSCIGVVLDGINISSGAENNTFIKVSLSNGIVFNSFSIKLYGLLVGTLALDIQDSSVAINSPWIEDCAKGIYFKNTTFTITCPIFVNTTVPIETYNHSSVKGRIDFILKVNVDASSIGSLNKLIIIDDFGNDIYQTIKSASHVYQSSAQAFSATTWATVSFNSKVYDNKTEFDITTYRFTASSTGIYLIAAFVTWATQVDGNRTRLAILKNNATSYYLAGDLVGGANASISKGTVNLKLNAGDYIELTAYTQNAVSTTSGDGQTYLTITRIA